MRSPSFTSMGAAGGLRSGIDEQSSRIETSKFGNEKKGRQSNSQIRIRDPKKRLAIDVEYA